MQLAKGSEIYQLCGDGKYFSASMINNEGVFQCCFPIDCVAEGDEDHLISRVGKPQDLQVWCEQVMLV